MPDDAAQKPFGNVDWISDGDCIGGWVFDPVSPSSFDRPIRLIVGGTNRGATTSTTPRADGFFGFSIHYSANDLRLQLIAGQVQIKSLAADGSEFSLRIHWSLIEESITRIFSSNSERDQLTPLLVRPGKISPDQSAIIGLQGFIFLFRGSNNLIEAYADRTYSALGNDQAARWLDLFSTRNRLLREEGVKYYIQCIIPEKSSVITSYAPLALGPITPLLRRIEEALSISNSDALDQSFYVSALEVLRSEGREETFMKTDSHLSVDGAKKLIRAILTRLATFSAEVTQACSEAIHIVDATLPSGDTEAFSGDLADRFFDAPLFERARKYTLPPRLSNSTITIRDSSAPADGSHLGTRISWCNSDAPINMRVMIFGNSFFERGGSPMGLSWWASRLFSDVEFLWSPAIDRERLALWKPDLVICQTIERFLGQLPLL